MWQDRQPTRARELGALALLESPYLGKLDFLNLDGNRLGNSMIEQIHAHPRARQTVILSNDPDWW